MRVKHFLIACSLFAALRVAYYSLVFPVFCNVDEEAHFDLVLKYSQGHIPESTERFSPEAAALIAQYQSPEFFMRAADYAEGRLPNFYETRQDPKYAIKLREKQNYWQYIKNHESASPPVYYAIAGCWLRLGILSGLVKFNSLFCLYWIRLLNVLFILVLVIYGCKAAALFYPDQKLLLFTVAFLLATIPQDAFYSIQSDGLSATMFCLCLYFFARLVTLNNSKIRNAIMCGSCLALTVLTKNSNLILLPVFLLLQCLFLFRRGSAFISLKSLLILAVAAIVPFSAWTLRNIRWFGDWTATRDKSSTLGWTVWTDTSHWWSNRIWTSNGFTHWSREFFASFWRGEYTWLRIRIHDPFSDQVFLFVSMALLMVFPVVILYRYIQKKQVCIDLTMYLLSVAMIFFIMFVSVRYNYGNARYPSKEYPYIISGRLVLAMLLPFVLLLSRLITLFNATVRLRHILVGLLIVFLSYMTIKEYHISSGSRHSTYNLLSQNYDRLPLKFKLIAVLLGHEPIK